MIITYPRLPTPAAVALLAELNEVGTHEELTRRAATEDSRSDSYPTGVQRSPAQLQELRDLIVNAAEQLGFPQQLQARGETATRFDREVSVLLLRHMQITPADAAQEGVWSFLSLVLLPDVAFWRWPNAKGTADYERLIGRPRNVFRRLWWRAYCLGESASALVFEDEAVAIMERTAIGGDIRLARLLAENHLRITSNDPSIPRTELLRQVAKRVRRLSVIRTFAALSDQELYLLVQQTSDEALSALLAARSGQTR